MWFTIARNKNFCAWEIHSKPYWKAKDLVQIWSWKMEHENFQWVPLKILLIHRERVSRSQNFNSMAPVEDNRGFSAKIPKKRKYTSIVNKVTYEYISVAKITHKALICCVCWYKMRNKFCIVLHWLYCQCDNLSLNNISCIWLYYFTATLSLQTMMCCTNKA